MLDRHYLEECLKSGVISAKEQVILDELQSIRSTMLEKFAGIEEGIAGVTNVTQGVRRALYTGLRADAVLKPVMDIPAVKVSFSVASAGLHRGPRKPKAIGLIDQSLIAWGACSLMEHKGVRCYWGPVSAERLHPAAHDYILLETAWRTRWKL